jgi:hypothetical protein
MRRMRVSFPVKMVALVRSSLSLSPRSSLFFFRCVAGRRRTASQSAKTHSERSRLVLSPTRSPNISLSRRVLVASRWVGVWRRLLWANILSLDIGNLAAGPCRIRAPMAPGFRVGEGGPLVASNTSCFMALCFVSVRAAVLQIRFHRWSPPGISRLLERFAPLPGPTLLLRVVRVRSQPSCSAAASRSSNHCGRSSSRALSSRYREIWSRWPRVAPVCKRPRTKLVAALPNRAERRWLAWARRHVIQCAQFGGGWGGGMQSEMARASATREVQRIRLARRRTTTVCSCRAGDWWAMERAPRW